MNTRKQPDFHVENHRSLWLVAPLNDAARAHLQEHVSDEALWFGGALVVEPRYIWSVVDVLQADGYEVR